MTPARITEAVLRLKETKRMGWVERGVEDAESVACHSYGLAVLALIEAQQRGLDTLKAVATALLHDLAESVTGDLTPEMKTAKGREAAEKEEQETLKQLLEGLPEAQRLWLVRLIDEYYEESTPEARLIRQLDRVEMALQAAWYKRSNRLGEAEASEFIQSSIRELSDTELLNLLASALSSIKPSQHP